MLSGTSAADIVPPAIALPSTPSQVMQLSTTTVTFSATDTESGVATISATLNGSPVANGEVITFTKPGKNIFLVTAIDKAGNPRVAELDVEVLVASTFTASNDTYLKQSDADRNFGTDMILRVEAGGNPRASFLRFDQSQLQNIIGSSSIVSATLALTVAGNGNDWGNGISLDVYRMLRDWTELGATWDCANDTNTANSTPDCPSNTWSILGPMFPYASTPTASAIVTNGTTNAVSYDVTGDIQSFVSQSNPNDGWIIRKPNDTDQGSIQFDSRETTSPPTLTVVWAP